MADGSIKFTSTSDMFDQLASVPTTVVVTGVVRPRDADEKSFDFSLRGCGAWIRVPAELVDRFEPIGRSRCDDHHHDVVRLHLKRPDDGHASVLADLLDQHQHFNLAAGLHVPMAGVGTQGGAGCPKGYYWDAAKGGCVPING